MKFDEVSLFFATAITIGIGVLCLSGYGLFRLLYPLIQGDGFTLP